MAVAGQGYEEELFRACREGNFSFASDILEEHPQSHEARTEIGDSPLIVAADSAFEILVRMLIRSGANKNFKTSGGGKTALHAAAARGSTPCVNALLEAHSDTEITNSFGNTAAIIASACNHEAALRRILEAGADTEVKNKDGMTAILMTAHLETEYTMRTLLQFHADADAQDPRGLTPLNAALFYPRRELFAKILIEGGADTEIDDNNEHTPLYHAAKDAYPGCVHILSSASADIEHCCYKGFTPLLIAAFNCTLPRADDRLATLVALAECGAYLEATVENKDGEIGFAIVQRSEEERRRLAIDRTSLWKCSEILGWKPTSSTSRKAIAELPTIKGKKTNARPSPEQVPSFPAPDGDDTDEEYEQFSPRSRGPKGATRGNILDLRACDSVESLASPMAPSMLTMSMETTEEAKQEGKTALIIIACQLTGGEDAAKYLVQAGADIENLDAVWGRTALMWAAIVGRWQMVETLLQVGANPDTQNKPGRTALMQACRVGNDRHVQVLVDGGANLELNDELKHTALITCINYNELKCMAIVIAAGANVNDTRSGYSPLVWAINEGSDEAARMLLENGAEVELQDKHGWTPLFHATAKGACSMAALLLEAGANTEAKDLFDRTPIMLAAHYDKQPAVSLLLQAGALGSQYHNIHCASKVDMAAGEAEVAAMNKDMHVEISDVENTLTLETPLSLMRRSLFLTGGTF